MNPRLYNHIINRRNSAASIFAYLVPGKIRSSDRLQLYHRPSCTRSGQSTVVPKQQMANTQRKEDGMSTLKKVKEEAIWGMFIADAIAMPVHWYYNPSDIKLGYGGWLTGYTAPAKHHPSSILTISSTGGSGRSGREGKSKPVIGSVILHDKLKYWTSPDRTTHYHQGMKAGDNTLTCLTALQFFKTMTRVDPQCTMDDRELRAHVLEDYVKFMTTPGSHNDTYAESFHRSFFKDWVAEKSPPRSGQDLLKWAENRYAGKCKGSSDHQIVAIGAFVPAIPWILHKAHKSETECVKSSVEFIKLTHPEPTLVPFIDMYSRLLHSVLNGHDLKQEILKYLGHSELGGPGKRQLVLTLIDKANGFHRDSESRLKAYQSAISYLGSACYVEGAFSSMLFLAIEFAEEFEAGILANANCGGENCHRGAALGALLGAVSAQKGQSIPQKLKDGLGSVKSDYLKVIQDMESLSL